jgi:hypothetical protein
MSAPPNRQLNRRRRIVKPDIRDLAAISAANRHFSSTAC